MLQYIILALSVAHCPYVLPQHGPLEGASHLRLEADTPGGHDRS